MTPDERNVLQPFLSDLAQSRGAAKDPEADTMIGQALRANPDAMYLLVQHAILADRALQAAQAQIEQMERQLGGGSAPPSFLGGDRDQGQGWAPQPVSQPRSPMAANSGLGSFLRSAGTMAAGVAGGEFLAEGLSNLFSPRNW